MTAILPVIWRGVRANLVPGLVLPVFALLIVGAYYLSAPVGHWLDAIGRLKTAWGYAFSAASTAFFGGLVPFLVLWFGRRIQRERGLLELAFYLVFWCYKGVEVDGLYRAQAWLFGADASVDVIVKKVLVDQFIYNPLWAAPTQCLFFLWKDAGFSFRRVAPELRPRAFIRRVLVVLVSTWVVWVPAVCIVYSLPSALQLILFNLVLCFWCLLLTFVAQQT